MIVKTQSPRLPTWAIISIHLALVAIELAHYLLVNLIFSYHLLFFLKIFYTFWFIFNTALKIRFTVCMCVCQVASVVSNSLRSHGSPSMGFSRQEYWSGLPCPSPGESSRPRDQTPALVGRFFTTSASWEAHSIFKSPITDLKKRKAMSHSSTLNWKKHSQEMI